MKYATSLSVGALAIIALLGMQSCRPTQYVDSDGTNLVVSMNKVNIQDFNFTTKLSKASPQR